MAGVPPQSMRQDEQNEQPLTGPFGGIQSEAPLSRIEDFGFANAENVIFRKGAAQVRSAMIPTGNILDNPILGIADFFDSGGVRHQCAMTSTHLYAWDNTSQTWGVVPGATFTGSNTQLFTWTVVADKLCFDQGVDPPMLWDGTGDPIVTLPTTPGNYLFELNFHLIVMHTVEQATPPATGTTPAIQRVKWSSAGDPTSWSPPDPTAFDSGQTDLFNDLGPITGGVKLFQQGFVMQYEGITQMVPTGEAIAPFEFIPLSSRAKGNVIPFSLSNFGEDIACYVGKDNIYSFDGNIATPIGDARVDGSRYRMGARKRILADLQLLQWPFTNAYGFITTSVNGTDYFAYWLIIPNLNLAWVYHFDENSWTRETFVETPTCVGNFFNPSINPFDSILIGFQDNQPRRIDFTGLSELPWFIESGNQHFRDFKHKKTVTAVRLVVDDITPGFTATLTLTTNQGYTQTQPVGPVGTGSGNSLTIIVPFQPAVTGTWIKWQLNGAANTPLNLTEITPYYDVGGTVRPGGID